jgi:hypothetical protein
MVLMVVVVVMMMMMMMMMIMMIMTTMIYSNNKFSGKYWAQKSMNHLRFGVSRDHCIYF